MVTCPPPFLTQEAPSHSTEHSENHRTERAGKSEDLGSAPGSTTNKSFDLGQVAFLL